MQKLSLLIVFVSLAICSLTQAQDWTRFHGPNGTGVGNAEGIPSTWTETDYNWKVKLPGIGHSSPVVWGDKVFLLSANPTTAARYVLCYDAASGKQHWVTEFESKVHHLHKFSSYASCTPAVDADHVYVGWSTPEETTLTAFDHRGGEVWSIDLGRWQSQHGFGTSPMLFEDMVILHNSQQVNQLKPGEKPGESFMMAFDRKTGEERWRTPLISANVCYTVPCIYTPENGKPELVCYSTGNGMFSLDPHTGKFNWSTHDGIDDPADRTFSMRTVASPIFAKGLVFGSTGSGGGGNYVVAIRPGKDAEVVYKIDRSANYVPTPVVNGDLIFLWYDKGMVTCVDIESGRSLWRQRVEGTFFSSPVRIGDRIFGTSDEGEVIVLSATKEFKELGRNPLGGPTRATPAISGGRIYFRTYSHLISLGGGSS